jgi:DNA-binding MarR family transcriptional regulator
MPEHALPPHPLDELLTQLVDHVFALSSHFLAAGDTITAPEGLSAARWLVLGALQNGPMSPAGIARQRGLTRQSVRESVARLEGSGHISRADGDDRRTFLVELTDKGRQALDRIEPRRREWATQTALNVDSAHLEGAVTVLGQLRSMTEARPLRKEDE